MKNTVKTLLSQDDLGAIAAAIGEAERHTIGEIRVSIRQKRRWNERSLTIEQLARKEFHHLGMTKTEQRTGILLFLLLSEKTFYLLADEGIHRKVEDGTWEVIAGEMSKHFSEKNFRHGIVHGVRSVGTVLAKNFPGTPGGKNELPDDVRVR